MVEYGGVKYSCLQCVRGHRTGSCHHTKRPLIQLRKRGRPTCLTLDGISESQKAERTNGCCTKTDVRHQLLASSEELKATRWKMRLKKAKELNKQWCGDRIPTEEPQEMAEQKKPTGSFDDDSVEEPAQKDSTANGKSCCSGKEEHLLEPGTKLANPLEDLKLHRNLQQDQMGQQWPYPPSIQQQAPVVKGEGEVYVVGDYRFVQVRGDIFRRELSEHSVATLPLTATSRPSKLMPPPSCLKQPTPPDIIAPMELDGREVADDLLAALGASKAFAPLDDCHDLEFVPSCVIPNQCRCDENCVCENCYAHGTFFKPEL